MRWTGHVAPDGGEERERGHLGEPGIDGGNH